jgi:hypothetical protein
MWDDLPFLQQYFFPRKGFHAFRERKFLITSMMDLSHGTFFGPTNASSIIAGVSGSDISATVEDKVHFLLDCRPIDGLNFCHGCFHLGIVVQYFHVDVRCFDFEPSRLVPHASCRLGYSTQLSKNPEA